MEYIGIDVHKNESQICILTSDGEILERRIVTRADRFAEALGTRPRARIVIEASTESEWVARCLEHLGHEVIVADPNYAPMYATRTRRVKTDRRDAQALMDACRLGAYRACHRTSEPQRQIRALLTTRDTLVRARTRSIQVVRALARREGFRVRPGEARTFPKRLRELDLPAWLGRLTEPLCSVMDCINAEIAELDARLAAVSGEDESVRRLCTVPGIGPVTATAFVATIDRVERFESAHRVEAYLGLVPSESSSGDRQIRGSVTKAGNGRIRWLLVEAAWIVMRSRRPETEQMRAWCAGIAVRRGRRIAAVALARRLAGVLYAMWRDRTEFRAMPLTVAPHAPAVPAN